MLIKTVNAFIDAIGGPSAAAEAFSVSRPAISNWKKTRRLPGWATMRAMSVAQTNGVVLDPKLFTRVRKPKSNAKTVLHAAE